MHVQLKFSNIEVNPVVRIVRVFLVLYKGEGKCFVPGNRSLDEAEKGDNL
jgi:hypothetical protein